VPSTDGMRRRPATPRDATLVARLIADGLATYREFAPDGWAPRSALREEPEIDIRLSRRDVRGQVAFAPDGSAAGFTGWMPAVTRSDPPQLIPGRGHIWSLFVAPAWWGSGLATELLDWSVSGMHEAGCTGAQLWTPLDHARARRFYEREGWETSGRVDYSPDIKLDLILYERALGG
jgi:GNAT superfamily N-acetyltransferase